MADSSEPAAVTVRRERDVEAGEATPVANGPISGAGAASPAHGPVGAPVSGPEGGRSVERWVESVRKAERPRRRAAPTPAKDSAEVLRKWVDGDDRAMEAWIQASESERPPPPAAPLPTPPETAVPSPSGGPESGAPVAGTPPAPGAVPAVLLEREQTVVRWLTDLLDRVKSDQFDPSSILQETQELHRQLYDERAKRKQLDEELEHVKRGSIAVIKYVRNREAKAREQLLQAKDAELADMKRQLLERPAAADGAGSDATGTVPEGVLREVEQRMRDEFQTREQQMMEREADLRRRTVQLEGEIRSLRAESQTLQVRLEAQGAETGHLSEVVASRMKEADSREREILLRENELRSKFEEIRIRAEEVERRKAPLAYKEKELIAWEQELKVRQQALDLESRRVEQAKAAEGPAGASGEALTRLNDLQSELSKKEEELKAREAFLHQRMEELEGLEHSAAESEAERMHAQAGEDARAVKLRTGVRRLDDLLFGGMPPGSQLLVNGPAHTGKDVLARLFVAEGLKEGRGALWVVTDRAYTTIREEMTAVLPAYPEYEKRGAVRYVDLYARSLGVTEAEPSVQLLSSTEKGVLEQLTGAANAFGQDLKAKFGGYRLVFESVSTVTAYLDTSQTFRFLQPFTGRRKMDGAASYYLLETGMHSDADLQTLEHMMDGSIHLKIDQLKTFLSVRGITDVQSRAWVGYNFSKKSFSLGSFSLDHIR